jgi:hypothetical protein
VTDWNETFLGIIAAATALMAVMQIGAMVVLARVAVQVRDLVGTVQKDIRPLIARATAVADEAHKTAAIAAVQAQKIDRLVTDLTRRVDETSLIIQQAIVTPAREGMAILAGIKAAVGALRSLRDARGRGGVVDDEDALFIG